MKNPLTTFLSLLKEPVRNETKKTFLNLQFAFILFFLYYISILKTVILLISVFRFLTSFIVFSTAF